MRGAVGASFGFITFRFLMKLNIELETLQLTTLEGELSVACVLLIFSRVHF
jgi:hypothetical protein